MLSEQEYKQIKSNAWSGTLTGYPSKRWEFANWFLIKDPKSDFTSYHMGITMLKQAAMQGFSRAQDDLAYHLYYGKGICKDEKKALEWCNKALEFRKRPEWVRLYNVITRQKKNIMLSNAQMGLYRAFLHYDISYIEP
jgi:TPR repeat protein